MSFPAELRSGDLTRADERLASGAAKRLTAGIQTDRLTRWHLLAAAGMAVLGVLVTLEAWRDIFHIVYNAKEGLDEEYSHIVIVPIVAVWMVWSRRMRLRYCRPSFTLLGPILVAIGWGMSAYGYYHGVQSFWHGGSLLVVIGCALSVLGKNVLFRFAPAWAVLVFLVPIPGMIRQDIALPLQRQTAVIADKCLETMGEDTEVVGNTLSINGKPVGVAEACNGMRMVFPLILVCYAFAFGMPLRNSVRMLLLLLSPLAALLCNVVRTVPLIWIYGHESQQMFQRFHDYAGWAMLPIAFLMLYGIVKLMQWALIPISPYTLAQQY